MRAALLIAARDLRERIRDRTALIVAVIAPFGLAAILGTVIPGGTTDIDLRYALADLDESAISQAFRDGPLAGLAEAGIAEITATADADAARAAVDADEAGAAFIIPAGFGAAVQAGEAAEIELVGRADAGITLQVGQAVASAYVAELEAVRLSVGTAIGAAGGGDPAEVARLAGLASQAANDPPPILVDQTGSDRAQVDSRTYFAAAMAIFFLFFTAQYGPLSLITERHNGTLARLLAAPIRPWTIVLGKSLGSFLLGIVATGVLAVASTLILGASWGNPLGVALLIVAGVVAATGLTAFVTTLARTEQQAEGWNSMLAVTLAILGGTFVPLSQAPEIMSRLSLITPHAWFMEGLNELAVPSPALGAVILPVAVLTAMGVVSGAIGLARAKRLLVAP